MHSEKKIVVGGWNRWGPYVQKTFANILINIRICLLRLCNRLTDVTLSKLMRIAIEGLEQISVNFEEVLGKTIIEFNFIDCLNN